MSFTLINISTYFNDDDTMERNLFALSVLASLLLVGCGDDKDSPATQNKTLSSETALNFADKDCWLGGQAIHTGLDKNGNGKLDADEIQNTKNQCNTENLFANGLRLGYAIMDIKGVADGAKPGNNIEFRLGGFGSDLVAHPTNKNQFYAVTDRGPNADFNINKDSGKILPDPSFTPRIGLFEVGADGTVKKIKEILFKDRDGQNITGLPNQNFGATKEAAYDLNGKLLKQQTDEYGLDSEGLVAMKDGTFWVSDEYGPHIVHYDATGKEIGRINPFSSDNRTQLNLPAEFAKRRANRGMEGLTITPDEKMLVGIMQSTMNLPAGSVNKQTITRIVTIELATGKIGQYLYRQEIAENSNSAIVALDNHSFLVLERDGKFYKDDANAMKHVYKIDLRQGTNLEAVTETATLKQDPLLGLTVSGKTLEQVTLDSGWEGLAALNIRPVSKTLVVDMVAQVNYPHDKMEGLWLMSNHRLGVINDDDFATWTKNNLIEQKYLDQAQTIIDSNTLYVIDDLDLNPLP